MSEDVRFGRTIRVEGGIRAQSARGAIGSTWWSRRFIAVLESFALGSRLTRGRNYARAGQVLSLTVTSGAVTAVVQGSRPQPYEVTIALGVLDETTWHLVEQVLADQALFSARLLAGDMPTQIEEVFTAAGSALFPTSAAQLAMHCSCPDWSVPCKHIAATFYLLAEAFDADPFQILHWRGRDRETLLARLRTLRSDGKPTPARSTRAKRARKPAPQPPVTGAASALAGLTSPDLEASLDRFWTAPVPLPNRPPTLDTEFDLLLRQLPLPPAVLGGAELVSALRGLYASFRATPTESSAAPP